MRIERAVNDGVAPGCGRSGECTGDLIYTIADHRGRVFGPPPMLREGCHTKLAIVTIVLSIPVPNARCGFGASPVSPVLD